MNRIMDIRDLALDRLMGEWRDLVTAGLPIATAGLAAARVAALGAMADHNADGCAWAASMAGARPATPAQLDRVWNDLSSHWAEAPPALTAMDRQPVTTCWSLLAPAEALMETGGDVRLLRDPQTDLNGYGCSHRPRPWAVTFASSTASSVSERGYAAADRARLRLTAQLLRGDETVIEREAQAVRAAIARALEVPAGGAVVLAASGTDSELLALALSQLGAGDRAITTILLAPEETGTGVPMAAVGRHFAVDTANGHDVARAAPIAGFRDDTTLVSIPLRDDAGKARPADAVDRDIVAAVGNAVAAGRLAVLHVLDLSKTGLLAPSVGLLTALRQRFGAGFDIVVDACQLRIGAARVRDYLALDAVVQVTGSKFLTGPPFAGAALLPPRIAARLEQGRLPRGLEAYFRKADWPRGVAAASLLPEGANYGLLLRWHAALAEFRAFAAVDEARKAVVVARFATTVEGAIARHGMFRLLDLPVLQREGGGWDGQRTVFAFAVTMPDRADGWLDPKAMRQMYHWLNADCSAVFTDKSEQRLAARICHIGQPVALPDDAGAQIGWLRVSAGARLFSGEPAHRGLAFERRLDLEMDDLATVFDKIALLHKNWTRVAAANPLPQYRTGHLGL